MAITITAGHHRALTTEMRGVAYGVGVALWVTTYGLVNGDGGLGLPLPAVAAALSAVSLLTVAVATGRPVGRLRVAYWTAAGTMAALYLGTVSLVAYLAAVGLAQGNATPTSVLMLFAIPPLVGYLVASAFRAAAGR